MAEEFKSPEEVADEWLAHLKNLKPSVNTSQTDSDWWIRSRVMGGVASGLYADQALVSDDTYPTRARRDALGRYLEVYFDDTFRPATQSLGLVSVSGVSGTIVPVGQVFTYEPNGNTYESTEETPLLGVTGSVPVTSIGTGQSQNLLSGAPLTVNSPPPGLDAVAAALGNISDGRDIESNELARQRILNFIRTPPAGGTAADYKRWAKEADESVVDASILRFPFGFGTVGVVVTAGTTDIDEAVDNDDPVVVVPSPALLDIVSTYIETKRPITDCVTVMAPVEESIPVNVGVRFQSGDLDTIPTGETLTQAELVYREVKRALYKTPPGGRIFGASGYVVASEIEEAIDVKLSALPFTEGTIPILIDRQVADLAVTGTNRLILPNQVAIPGTVIVTDLATGFGVEF